MLGLQGTPYSDRVFKLEIAVLERYTFELPKQRFFTRIYHLPPEHDSGGCICLDILKMPPQGACKTSMNISRILTSLQVLIAKPNPDNPLMPEIAISLGTTKTSTWNRQTR